MTEDMTKRSALALMAAGAGLAAGSQALGAAAPAAGPERKRVAVLDTEMSYLEAGKGDPIVFLHGNPTSSYLWRNILPQLTKYGRCLAPDLVGMGQSKGSPTFSYRFVDHARYLDAWFDAVGATRNVTLVIHDWGSALGFHRAFRHQDQVRAIAYMEALVADRQWADFGPFEQAFRAIRSDAGVEMVLGNNFFVEQVLPGAVLRKLTPEEMDAYRAPFPTRESRIPTLVWPRQIPVEGKPADVAKIMADFSGWLKNSPIPKLYFDVEPGTMPPAARALCRTFPNQKVVTVKGVHYVQEDSPNEIAAALKSFVKSL